MATRIANAHTPIASPADDGIMGVLDSLIVDRSRGETPAVETPAVETPSVEAPAVETPAVEAPEVKAEEPVVPDVVPDAQEDPVAPPPEVVDDPQALYTWEKLRRERREAVQKASELESRLAAAGDAETEALRGRVASLEEELAKADITRAPSFKVKFDEPMSARLGVAANALVQAGLPKGDALKLVSALVRATDESAREEMLLDYSPAVQGKVLLSLNEHDALRKDRDTALADWKATGAELAERQRREAASMFAQTLNKDIVAAVESARTEGNFFLSKSGDADWDARVDAIPDTLRGIVKNAAPAEILKYVAEGITARDTRELLSRINTMNKKLRDEVVSLRRATPQPAADRHGPVAPRAMGDMRKGANIDQVLDSLPSFARA